MGLAAKSWPGPDTSAAVGHEVNSGGGLGPDSGRAARFSVYTPGAAATADPYREGREGSQRAGQEGSPERAAGLGNRAGGNAAGGRPVVSAQATMAWPMPLGARTGRGCRGERLVVPQAGLSDDHSRPVADRPKPDRGGGPSGLRRTTERGYPGASRSGWPLVNQWMRRYTLVYASRPWFRMATPPRAADDRCCSTRWARRAARGGPPRSALHRGRARSVDRASKCGLPARIWAWFPQLGRRAALDHRAGRSEPARGPLKCRATPVERAPVLGRRSASESYLHLVIRLQKRNELETRLAGSSIRCTGQPASSTRGLGHDRPASRTATGPMP